MKKGGWVYHVVLLAAGLAAGFLLARELATDGARQTTGGRRILYWVAPMDPSYRSDKPGKSPMGMDLIPVYEGEEPADKTTVRIDPVVVQNLGVRTAVAKRMPLKRRIETVGIIAPDENLLSHLHVRAAGWAERLLVKAAGDRVQKGQALLALYSPDLVDAQVQYLQALAIGQKSLTTAARERLRALGMSGDQISRLERLRKPMDLVPVHAPQDGYVIALNIRQGMYVEPKTTIMSIADLQRVWVLVDVFEDQLPWIRQGDQAQMQLAYLPGKRFEGRVDYVYPTVDPKTRTAKVRLVFANPGGLLKPDMYAFVTIHAAARPDSLVIPREALIRTGRSERVILALGDGRFRPARVVSGVESGDWIEIRAGLREGERVVTSGQFLIDSEASLAGTILRMSPDDGVPAAAGTHGGHSPGDGR